MNVGWEVLGRGEGLAVVWSTRRGPVLFRPQASRAGWPASPLWTGQLLGWKLIPAPLAHPSPLPAEALWAAWVGNLSLVLTRSSLFLSPATAPRPGHPVTWPGHQAASQDSRFFVNSRFPGAEAHTCSARATANTSGFTWPAFSVSTCMPTATVCGLQN